MYSQNSKTCSLFVNFVFFIHYMYSSFSVHSVFEFEDLSTFVNAPGLESVGLCAYIYVCIYIVYKLFSSEAFFYAYCTYTYGLLRTRKLVHWRVLGTRT